MENESEWSVILSIIYNEGSITSTENSPSEQKAEIHSEISNNDRIDLSESEVKQTIGYMQQMCLIQVEADSNRRDLTLTEQGFRVAHDREIAFQELHREQQRSKREHKINQSIAVLTLGLVLIGIIRAAIVGMVEHDASLFEINAVLTLGVGVVLVILYLVWSDVFDTWEPIEAVRDGNIVSEERETTDDHETEAAEEIADRDR